MLVCPLFLVCRGQSSCFCWWRLNGGVFSNSYPVNSSYCVTRHTCYMHATHTKASFVIKSSAFFGGFVFFASAFRILSLRMMIQSNFAVSKSPARKTTIEFGNRFLETSSGVWTRAFRCVLHTICVKVVRGIYKVKMQGDYGKHNTSSI